MALSVNLHQADPINKGRAVSLLQERLQSDRGDLITSCPSSGIVRCGDTSITSVTARKLDRLVFHCPSRVRDRGVMDLNLVAGVQSEQCSGKSGLVLPSYLTLYLSISTGGPWHYLEICNILKLKYFMFLPSQRPPRCHPRRPQQGLEWSRLFVMKY